MTTVSHITTHVLDSVLGLPAPGVAVQLFALREGEWELLAEAVTDADGRAKQLGPEALSPGTYHVPLLLSPFAYSTYRGS